MQPVRLLFVLICLQAFAACSKTDHSSLSSSVTQLGLHSKNECELIFKSQNALVVENFCNKENKPILIRLAGQEIKADWIDEKTSRFLFQEGCAKADACFYELRVNGSGVRGRFVYQINLTEGDYSFEVDGAGKPRLLSESSVDVAS